MTPVKEYSLIECKICLTCAVEFVRLRYCSDSVTIAYKITRQRRLKLYNVLITFNFLDHSKWRTYDDKFLREFPRNTSKRAAVAI